jgi:hypothetical protein
MVGRPPHRVIHLCENGLIRPARNAVGRGKVRRFDRENIFRIQLALNLQDAGLDIAAISPLMSALDGLMKFKPVKDLRPPMGYFDLIWVLGALSGDGAVLAWLAPAEPVTLVIPAFSASCRPSLGLNFQPDIKPLLEKSVGIVINLTAHLAVISS